MSLETIASEKNLDELKPTTAVNLVKLIKRGIITTNRKGTIVYRGSNIVWENLKTQFKNGEIDESLLRGIGGLRRCTLMYLFNKLKMGKKKCYAEIGSDTPTSDLDFTYVAYSAPESMVERLIKFYETFYTLYGNFPDVTFDTNFYIVHLIVNRECFSTVKNSIKPFFRPILSGSYYSFDNFNKKHARDFDYKVCFQAQKFQKKLMSTHHQKNYKLENLIDYANLFYGLIDGGRVGDFDETLLFLRTCSYIMCVFANEAYVSDITLRAILYRIPLKTEEERWIAFVDQYLFIYEWYHTYKERQKDVIEFFDIVSKYIFRAGICLENSILLRLIPQDILVCAAYWKDNVRGKMSMEDAKKLVISSEILKIIPDVSYLFSIFDNIFGMINVRLRDADAMHYFESVLKENKTRTKVFDGRFYIKDN